MNREVLQSWGSLYQNAIQQADLDTTRRTFFLLQLSAVSCILHCLTIVDVLFSRRDERCPASREVEHTMHHTVDRIFTTSKSWLHLHLPAFPSGELPLVHLLLSPWDGKVPLVFMRKTTPSRGGGGRVVSAHSGDPERQS